MHVIAVMNRIVADICAMRGICCDVFSREDYVARSRSLTAEGLSHCMCGRDAMRGGALAKMHGLIMFCQDAIGPSSMLFERIPDLGARIEAIGYQRTVALPW